MRKTVLSLLLLLAALAAWAQGSKEDSLLQVLSTTSVDTSRAMLYNQLCKAVIQTHPDQGLKYARSGYEISRRAHFLRGLSLITNNLAICQSRIGRLDSALHYYREALEYRYQLGDKVLIADVNNNIGSLYYRQGRFRDALREYELASKTYREAGDKKGEAGILNNKGSILKEMGLYTDALDHYMRAVELYRTLNDQSRVAMVSANIGMVYHVQKFYAQAITHFQQAEAIHRELGDLHGVVAELNSLGEVYLDMREWDKATSYLEQARRISVETGFKYGEASALLTLGQVGTERGDPAATALIEEARRLYHESGFSQGEMMALHWKGRLLVRQGRHQEALPPLLLSLQMAREQESNNQVRENYEYLSKAYAGVGDYKEAFRFQGLFTELHDSLFSMESTEKIAEMQGKYELAENERRIAQLEREKADQALAGAERSRYMWYLVGGIVIVVLVLALIVVLLLVQRRHSTAIQRKNIEIEAMNASLETVVQVRTADLMEVNQELDTFLHESTHALRRPLTRIMGLSDLLSSVQSREQLAQYLAMIGVTVRSMDAMLEKLIQVDEARHRSLQLETIDLRQVAQSAADRLKADHVQFHIHIPQGYTLHSDPFLVRVVLQVLLENAVQFPRPGVQHVVTVDLIPGNQSDELRVTDNGMGIPAEVQPHLFKMFYRGTERSKGNGLGLYVLEKVLHRLHGSVRVQSQPGEYASFSVMLPRF